MNLSLKFTRQILDPHFQQREMDFTKCMIYGAHEFSQGSLPMSLYL